MPVGIIHQRALDGIACGGFFLIRQPHGGAGNVLRALMERVDALGINDSPSLLSCDDLSLQTHLRDYLGDWLRSAEHHNHDPLAYLRHCAEMDHVDELFPDAQAIHFNSAAEFESLAERFLQNESARRDITDRMRRVVLDRFGYKSTVDRVLHAMTDYLASQAT